MSVGRKFYFSIGNQLRSIRLSRGKDAEQLAKEAEMSTKYLYQIENGKLDFSILVLEKLCIALGVQEVELLLEV